MGCASRDAVNPSGRGTFSSKFKKRESPVLFEGKGDVAWAGGAACRGRERRRYRAPVGPGKSIGGADAGHAYGFQATS
jgi:hypothetical protein